MYQLLCFENGSVLEKKRKLVNFLQRRVGFYLEMNITSNTNVLPVVGIPKNLYGQKGTKYWYLKTITLRVVWWFLDYPKLCFLKVEALLSYNSFIICSGIRWKVWSILLEQCWPYFLPRIVNMPPLKSLDTM